MARVPCAASLEAKEQVGVRWIKGFEFGVTFDPLDEGAADRLRRLLDDALDSGRYREWPSPS
jgi:hypothetical protein